MLKKSNRVCFVATILFGLVLVPAVQGAVVSSTTPCIAMTVLPPSARVDPFCYVPPPLDLTPQQSGFSVNATWTVVDDLEGIAWFELHRGATPGTLEEVAILSGESRFYVDEAAMTRGDALWYQIEAFGSNGTSLGESAVTVVRFA